MLLHDRLDRSQTQAAAPRLCRKAGFEYSVSNAFWYPGTAILNLDSHIPSGGKPGGQWQALIHVLGAHQKLASLWGSFTGIDNHVLDDLSQLNRITNDWVQIRLIGKVRLELRPAERQKHRVGENFRNVERLLNRSASF